MKHMSMIFGVLFSVLTVCGLTIPPVSAMAQDVVATSSEASSELLITSSPWGIVSVDGQRIGNTPAKTVLTPGTHVIVIRRPGKGEISKTVEFKSCEKTVISCDFAADSWHVSSEKSLECDSDAMGSLRMADAAAAESNGQNVQKKEAVLSDPVKFLSTPVGARVFIDGAYLGQTPIDDVIAQPGRHSVQLNWEDDRHFISVVRDIDVIPGKSDTLQLDYDFTDISRNSRDWKVIENESSGSDSDDSRSSERRKNNCHRHSDYVINQTGLL